jgi:hypothetical protein
MLTLNNLVGSQSTTGNATVIGNTTAGSGTTGNAQALANIVNMLQSSSNVLGGDTVTFVSNINGDVNGDLMIDPNAVQTVQPAIASPGTNNLTLNNQVNSAINNTVDLQAASGNATVSNNTSAGNATTGSAKAVADVVNVINSAISGGKSFLGVVNINGNFNGDILVPPNFIDQLIAANVPTVTISTTGPSSDNRITNGQTGNTQTVSNTTNQNITNTVNATAASGTATVTNNTSAGSATTGSAATNITAFNLTGSNVIGANALLVFVNVLGTWVGMIVNAPAGVTAAELGGSVTSSPAAGKTNTTINNNANQQINNTINVASRSGNAAVSSNTIAGNAKTGDAQTAVNLLNISNSSLSLAGWFGILFINVFGNWHGSFGVNTSAGDPPIVDSQPSAVTAASSSAPAPIKVFRFVPHNTASTSTPSQTVPATSAVLAAHIGKPATVAKAQQPNPHHSLSWLAVLSAILFASFIIGEGFYSFLYR